MPRNLAEESIRDGQATFHRASAWGAWIKGETRFEPVDLWVFEHN